MRYAPSLLLILGALIPSFLATSNDCDRKVWTFGLITDDRGVADPADDTGEILANSLEKALIPAVCKIAKQKCKIVGIQIADCNANTRGRSFPGAGILGGHFDACVQMVPSLERASALKFSYPYSEQPELGFYVLHGNPHHFKPHSSKFTVGVKEGYSAGPQCLNRQGLVFKKVVTIFSLDILAALLAGDVDAILIELNGPDDKSKLEMVGKPFMCGPGGISLATRKDSKLTTWWNAAFHELVARKGYHHICKKVKDADWPCIKKIGKAIKRFQMDPILSHKTG